MGVESFIARRLAFSKQKAFSGFIIKIAIAAVSLSVAVMIIATAFVNGFKSEIQRKVFGFMGHIQVSSFESSYAFQSKPIATDPILEKNIESLPNTSHVHAYANKTTILKSDSVMEGIALKGIGLDFNWDFFRQHIVEGETFQLQEDKKSKAILLSKTTARHLKVEPGDKLLAYFWQDPIRTRSFIVSGIFNTGLIEYDESFALVDIRHIQKLNNWEDSQIEGYEVFLKDANKMEATNEQLYYNILGANLLSRTLREINPSIFDWLDLQSMNERVIFTLMIIVTIINMITALLILIMERTNMIGILKALGSSNWSIRKLFLFSAAFIVGFGLLFGNALGFLVCFLQHQFELIKLSEESYFIEVVPVYINWFTVFLINLFSFIICLLILIIPSYLIAKISPVKAIRFD